jgi:hypothetical protein
MQENMLLILYSGLTMQAVGKILQARLDAPAALDVTAPTSRTNEFRSHLNNHCTERNAPGERQFLIVPAYMLW